ncbi:MAG: TonB family protein [Opitutaceae bacterium]|nr:TonB family protein [Opitutaceae bacterium]
MKINSLLAGAVLLSGLFSASALARFDEPTPWPQAPRDDVPVVNKVVNPTNLRRHHMGAEVEVAFTVDATGQPRDIRFVKPVDHELAARLMPALEQWRFTPAQKNGVPVPTKVVMPLKVISNS